MGGHLPQTFLYCTWWVAFLLQAPTPHPYSLVHSLATQRTGEEQEQVSHLWLRPLVKSRVWKEKATEEKMAFPVDRSQPICASWPREDLEKKERVFFFFLKKYTGERKERKWQEEELRERIWEFERESTVVWVLWLYRLQETNDFPQINDFSKKIDHHLVFEFVEKKRQVKSWEICFQLLSSGFVFRTRDANIIMGWSTFLVDQSLV